MTPCVPAPAGWKSLSDLALKCLDVLPLTGEEVQKGLGHAPDTAAPSTWTWIGEEREMRGKYHRCSVRQSVIRAADCFAVHSTWAVVGVKNKTAV